MKSSFLLLILIIVTIFYSVTSESVRALSTDDFSSVAEGSTPALIEFYAPWCGHCKSLAPEYEIVAEVFKPHTSSVIVAKVDCDANSEVCSSNDVSGYPTLKWFPGSGAQAVNYDGGRTSDDIISFINSKTGLNAKVKKPITKALELIETEFDEIILNRKFIFVEFYAPWCGHCKQLAPIWEKLAIAFQNERNVVIAKIDVATGNEGLATRYGVEGFPTLILFTPDNSKGEKYEGSRDLEALVSFMNEKAGTHRKSDGSLTEKAGRIEQLDDLARRFVSNEEQRNQILEETKVIAAEKGQQGMIYVNYMEKIMKKGVDFAENEGNRLKKILTTSANSIQADKKDDFQKRVNVAESFQQQE